MAFTERLKVVIDVVTGNATNSLTNFRKSVSEAQGFTGKLKAGVNGLTGAFASAVSSPTAVASALSAVTVAAIAAANQFAALSKTAIDLSKATGLSIEQSSRWIAVADDMGLAADDLTAPLIKIAKTIDSPAWEKYGIATRDASGNVRSANDIFLDTLDRLGRISNATERAQVGTELFGKGWAKIAPMIGKSRREYKDLLDQVSAGQTVTEAEAKRAEKWRLAMDNLSDAWKDFQYQLGSAATEITPLAEDIASLSSMLANLNTETEIQGVGAVDVASKIVRWSVGVTNLWDKYMWLHEALRGNEEQADATSESLDYLGDPHYPYSLEVLAGSFEEVSGKARITATHIRDVEYAFQTLLNQIDQRSMLRSIMDDFDDLQTAADEYWTAVDEGATDAAAKEREYQQALDDVRKKIIEYADSLGGIPPAAVTKILAEFDQGSYDTVKRLLAGLSTVRITYYGRIQESGIPVTTTTQTLTPTGTRALGGPVSANSMYQVAEGGMPELLTDGKGRTYLIPGTDGVVTPISSATASTSAVGGQTFNITITNPLMSGEQLANELKAYIRRNGSGWLS